MTVPKTSLRKGNPMRNAPGAYEASGVHSRASIKMEVREFIEWILEIKFFVLFSKMAEVYPFLSQSSRKEEISLEEKPEANSF